MIRAGLLILGAGMLLFGQAQKVALPGGPLNPQKAMKIAPGSFFQLERSFDQKLAVLFDVNEPLDILGRTRGVYVDGFGVVFTTEVSLIRTPGLSPFQPQIPKSVADRVRLKKVERLPFLKAAMKEMMSSIGRTFAVQVPADQQVVLVVRFLYEPWEDMNGMPSQVLMRASRNGAVSGQIQLEEQ